MAYDLKRKASLLVSEIDQFLMQRLYNDADYVSVKALTTAYEAGVAESQVEIERLKGECRAITRTGHEDNVRLVEENHKLRTEAAVPRCRTRRWRQRSKQQRRLYAQLPKTVR